MTDEMVADMLPIALHTVDLETQRRLAEKRKEWKGESHNQRSLAGATMDELKRRRNRRTWHQRMRQWAEERNT